MAHKIPINPEKIKEQVEVESKVRRNYPIKWGTITQRELYKFYNPNKINIELQDSHENIQTSIPYEYRGIGDSYFVSKQMYESLIEKCRCGRKKCGTHLFKCLQKTKFKHFDVKDNDFVDDNKTESSKNEVHLEPPLPKTSAGMIGWPNAQYRQWDRMTYATNIADKIIGYRVTDHPYNNIFIG